MNSPEKKKGVLTMVASQNLKQASQTSHSRTRGSMTEKKNESIRKRGGKDKELQYEDFYASLRSNGDEFSAMSS